MLIYTLSAQSQCPETNPHCNTANNWIFGDSVWLNFGDHNDVTKRTFDYRTYEATTSFSNYNGQLKLFGTPEKIFNITNSTWLEIRGGESSTQGSIFLGSTNKSNKILYVTNDEGNSTSNTNLYLHEIDIDSLNLSIINKILLRKTPEGLGTINHSNQKYSWLVSHSLLSDSFYLFIKLNDALLCCPKVVKGGGSYSKGQILNWLNGGCLRFSPNGKFLVSSYSNLNAGGYGRVDLFRFDNEKGDISDNIVINLQTPFAASFSPASNYLYIASNRLFQYDVQKYDSQSVNATQFQITANWNNAMGNINLTPNGVIYVAYLDSSYLGVINNPNNSGNSCNYQEKGIVLESNKSLRGLPNFNASYFYTPSIDFAYTEDCWEHTYSFEGRDTFDADGYKWIFEKSGYRDSIHTKHCSYQFPDTGSWQVSHIAWNANRADTVTKTLTIRPKWQKDVLGRDTFYCAGSKALITLRAPADMHCVHWNGEEPNLDETLGPIVDYDHFHTDTLRVDTAGTYIVKLTNKTFCQMWDTIVVAEKPRPSKGVVSRLGNLLTSDVVATQYRWYYSGALQQTTDSNFLDPNQNGYWQVQLVSEFGCESEMSDSFYVGFASIGDIRHETLDFRLYPNPSDGQLTIEVPKKGVYQTVVSDMTGKQVFSTSQNLHLTLEFAFELARGTYTLQLTDEDGKVGVKKVVVE